MENVEPPFSPQIKDGKMARFCPLRGFILDLWGGGGWGGRLIYNLIFTKFLQKFFCKQFFVPQI